MAAGGLWPPTNPMDSIDKLLSDGDLDGVRAALIDAVRNDPKDQSARMFLFQLCAVLGEWDKAATHLRALASLSPEAQMLSVVYNQVIEAEKQRLAAFAGQGTFPLLVPSAPWVSTLAESLAAQAGGDRQAGDDLRDKAFSEAPETPGTCDGTAFAWVADGDPRLGPAFEVILAGRWGLIGFDAVVSITSPGPVDLRDLVWLPVEIALKSGQSAAGFLPARYPGSEAGDAQIRLGRRTDWSPETGEGLGQRLWTFDTDNDVGVLSFRHLAFG